jgi:hypothetical protein
VLLLLAGAGTTLVWSQTNDPPGDAKATSVGQTAQPPSPEQPGVLAPGKTAQGEDKRIMGVLPNYRTAEMTSVGHPLTSKQKLRIATKDTFDYPLMILSAGYAGLYQLADNHPQFGQGVSGYFKRLGTTYTDQMTGNMLTEGLLPAAFHSDPRYFRMATGPKTRRTLYSLSRIFVTYTDSGKTTFNYAEVLGNGISAGIGLSYYSDDRNVPDYLQNWGIALATDAGSQILKEFWPDIKQWWQTRHHSEPKTGH